MPFDRSKDSCPTEPLTAMVRLIEPVAGSTRYRAPSDPAHRPDGDGIRCSTGFGIETTSVIFRLDASSRYSFVLAGRFADGWTPALTHTAPPRYAMSAAPAIRGPVLMEWARTSYRATRLEPLV